MWRSRLSRTWDWLRSRKLVGEDEHHFFYTEFISADKPERRYVEYKDHNITHSSDRMAIEWWSWLHNRRDDTPSREELAMSEAKQQRLAEKVAILEAEDEKQRLRQFAGGQVAQTAQAAEEEVRARRRKKAMMRLTNAASPGGADAIETREAGKMSGEDAAVNPEETPSVRVKRIYARGMRITDIWRLTCLLECALRPARLLLCRARERVFNLARGNPLQGEDRGRSLNSSTCFVSVRTMRDCTHAYIFDRTSLQALRLSNSRCPSIPSGKSARNIQLWAIRTRLNSLIWIAFAAFATLSAFLSFLTFLLAFLVVLFLLPNQAIQNSDNVPDVS